MDGRGGWVFKVRFMLGGTVGGEEVCWDSATSGIKRRNRQLRLVIRPDPLTLTLYWSKSNALTTVPTLSHLRGCLPP